MSVFHFMWIMCHFMVGLSSFFLGYAWGDLCEHLVWQILHHPHNHSEAEPDTELGPLIFGGSRVLVANWDLPGLVDRADCGVWISVLGALLCSFVLVALGKSLNLIENVFVYVLVPNKNFSQCKKYLQYLYLIYFAGRRCYIKKTPRF